jgi:SAM-dependent methyltransferase
MHTCPVCGDTRLEAFLSRARVPVHQNLIYDTEAEALGCARGDLRLAVCGRCGLVFNRAFDESRLAYGEHYDNTQSCSPAFDSYLDGLVKALVERHGVRNSTVVEVGCGKGAFLRKLVAYPNANNRGFGFDASYVGPASDLGGQLQFRKTFYDESCADVAADFVVCRHVIEHVPDPLALLRQVRAAIRDKAEAKVFFETPCVDWILCNRVFWDFFYEHCSLFSPHSLPLAFGQSGFSVTAVKHTFQGQYLWIEAGLYGGSHAFELATPATPGLARAFSSAEEQMRTDWIAKLDELRQTSRIAFWGAGAKGATLVNLVDPSRTRVDCVVDINLNKQGKFIPGTAHPIVAPHDLKQRGIDIAVLMNPNYRAEIEEAVAAGSLDVELIDGWTE